MGALVEEIPGRSHSQRLPGGTIDQGEIHRAGAGMTRAIGDVALLDECATLHLGIVGRLRGFGFAAAHPGHKIIHGALGPIAVIHQKPQPLPLGQGLGFRQGFRGRGR